MEKIQKIGVTAFIRHDGKVLLMKRSQKEKFLPGHWEMPGGKVEFGEDVSDAVAREVREETNLETKTIGPYSAFSYVSDNGNRHTVDIQFLVEVIGDIGDLKTTKAHDEAKWISEDEVDKLEISDSMKEAVMKGFQASLRFL